MNPSRSDISSNQPQDTQIFQTPWQNKFLGIREKLCLIRNKDGTVKAQLLTQNAFKRFTYFLGKKLTPAEKTFPKEKKYEILQEKNFTDISLSRFEREKANIQELLEKHTSLKTLLSQIEIDFKSPEQESTFPHRKESSSQDITPSQGSKDSSLKSKESLSAEIDGSKDDSSINDMIPLSRPTTTPVSTESQEPDLAVPVKKEDSSADDLIPLPVPTKPAPPILSEQEIYERNLTIEELRSELETLMTQIQEQEAVPELKSYMRLENSVQKIKATALKTFSEIHELERDANDPTVSSKTLHEAVKEIKDSNTQWNQDIAAVRQTLLEEAQLKKTIDSFSERIALFPENIQQTWEDLLAEWQETPVSHLSSLTAAKLRRKEIDTIIETVSQQIQKDLDNVIDTAIEKLKKKLTSNTFDHSNQKTNQAISQFKTIALMQRIKAWRALKDNKDQLDQASKDFIALQERVAKEQALDKSLIELIATPIPEKSYLRKIYSSFTSPFKGLLPASFFSSQPPETLVDKDFFDEVAQVYAIELFAKIDQTLAEAFTKGGVNTPALESLFERFIACKGEQVMKSDLDTLIHDFIVYAETEYEGEDQELFIDTARQLAGLQGALDLVIYSQTIHNESLIAKTRSTYPTIFLESTHPSILETAQATLLKILPADKTDSDLKSLSVKWEKEKNAAIEPISILENLQTLADIHSEYQAIAKKTSDLLKKIEDKEEKDLLKKLSGQKQNEGDEDDLIPALTGKEKILVKEALDRLNEVIDSLDIGTHTDKLEGIAVSYKAKLLKADKELQDLFGVESKKAALRADIFEQIEDFDAEIDSLVLQVQTLEKTFSVTYPAVKEKLAKTKQDLAEWKKKGTLPTSYLNYVPQAAIGSLLYYTSSSLPSNQVSLLDLSLEELPLYLESVKSEIAVQKNTLSYEYITEAYQSLLAFQEEATGLETHIKSLTSAVKTQKANKVQIPKDLSTQDLPKLQFYNAAITGKRLQEIRDQQQIAVQSDKSLKSVHQTLKADKALVKRALNQSQKATDLALLVQIERLADNPTQQNTAKLAFMTSLATKMNDHTEAMSLQVAAFKGHGKIQEESTRLLTKTKKQLSTSLKSAPSTIQKHAEQWNPLKEADRTTISTPPVTLSETEVVALSVADLRSYASHVDLSIKTGAEQMAIVKDTYKKVEESSRLLQQKIIEAKTHAKSLGAKDQLIAKAKLEEQIQEVEKARNQQIAPPKRVKQEEGWLNQFSSLFTTSSNPYASDASIVLLKEYQRVVAKSITQLEAAMRLHTTDLTIPQQIALNPDHSIAEELRKRFHERNLPLITAAKDRLQAYKRNGVVFAAYSTYVPPQSRLYQDIENSVNKKLRELTEYETAFHTDGALNMVLGSTVTKLLTEGTAITKLSVSQMESYAKKMTNIQNAYVDDLNDKFYLNDFTKAQLQYEKAKEKAKDHADQLRKNGHYYEAFLFEKKINALVENEKNTWEKKVTNVTQLKSLIRALNEYTEKIQDEITNHNPQELMLYEEQIRNLLKAKNDAQKISISSLLGYSKDALSPETLKALESDVIKLKSKLIAKVEEKRKAHKQSLQELRENIEDIYSNYKITFKSKDAVLKAIENELQYFSLQGLKFTTTDRYFSSYLPIINATKPLMEMTVEELLIAKAEKTTADLIEASNQKIAAIFPYELIQKPHSNYKAALKKAELTKLRFEREGQFSHAASLNDSLSTLITDKVKLLTKQTFRNEADLRALGRSLDDHAYSIESLESKTKSEPELTPRQQAALIIPTSAYRDKLSAHLVKDIQSVVEKQAEKTTQIVKDLNYLVKKIGFPRDWQSQIALEVESAQKAVKSVGSHLNVKTKGYFVTSEKSTPVEDLGFDDLLVVHERLETSIFSFNDTVNRFSLSSLTSKAQLYEEELKKIQLLKAKWISEHHLDSADKLDALVARSAAQLQLHFQSASNDLPKEIESLLEMLHILTKELVDETAKLSKEKPKSEAQRLIGLDPTSIEFKKIHQNLRIKLQAKITAQQKVLTDYTKQLETLSQKIDKVSNKTAHVPNSWKLKVQTKIHDKNQQLNRLMHGLPFIEIETGDFIWKPFGELTVDELISYEKTVDRLTEKNEELRSNKVSPFGGIESRVGLERIIKQLGVYENALTHIERLAKQNKYDKKILFEAILTANKQLVYDSFKNLTTLEDTELVLESLGVAIASLYKAYNDKDKPFNPDEIDQSPWVLIQYFEAKKAPTDLMGAKEKHALSFILKDGFSVSFNSGDPEIMSPYSTPGLEKIIDNWIETITKQKSSYEKKFSQLQAAGFKDDSALAKQLLSFTTNEMPKFIAELQALKNGLPIRERNGTHTIIEPDRITTVEQLSKYRTHVLTTIHRIESVVLEHLDESIMVLTEEEPAARPARSGAPGLGLGLDPAETDVDEDIPLTHVTPVVPIVPGSFPAASGIPRPMTPVGTPVLPIGSSPAPLTHPTATLPVTPVAPVPLPPATLSSARDIREKIDAMQTALNDPSIDLNSLPIKKLNKLAGRLNANLTFTAAYQDFQRSWNNREARNVHFPQALRTQKELIETIRVIDPNLVDTFSTFYFTIVHPTHDHTTDHTLSQIVSHIEILSNVGSLKDRLVTLASGFKQISDTLQQTNTLLTANQLPTEDVIVARWNTRRMQLMNITTLDELADSERELQAFIEESRKTLDNATKLCAGKQEIVTLIDNSQATFSTALKLIQDTLEEEFGYINVTTSQLFASLKTSYQVPGRIRATEKRVSLLSLEDLPNYKKHVDSTLAKELPNLTTVKAATEAYKQKVDEIKAAITKLRTDKRYDSASQLSQLLKETQDSLNQSAQAYRASPELTELTPAINKATKKLETNFVEILGKKDLPIDLPGQIPAISENNAEFNLIKNQIIATNKAASDTINATCLELITNISKNILGATNMIDELKSLLLEELDRIQALITPATSARSVRRGFSLSKTSVELDNLTKAELITYAEESKVAIQEANKQLKLLTEAFVAFGKVRTTGSAVSKEIAVGDLILQRLRESNITPYPYFYIDQIKAALRDLTAAAENLEKFVKGETFGDFEDPIEAFAELGKAVENKLKAYTDTLEAVKEASNNYTKSPGALEQLHKADENPGILSDVSRRAILTSIEAFTKGIVTKRQKEMDDYFAYTLDFPPKVKDKIKEVVESEKAKLLPLTVNAIQSLKSNAIREKIKALQSDSSDAVKSLEETLKLDVYDREYDALLTTQTEMKKLIQQCKDQHNYALLCDLQVALDAFDTDFEKVQTELASSKISLEVFWSKFNRHRTALHTVYLANRDKDIANTLNLDEQIKYLETTYPKTYKTFAGYKLLLTHRLNNP